MNLMALYSTHAMLSVDALYNEAHEFLSDRSHRAMRAYIKADRSPHMVNVVWPIIIADLANAVVEQVLADA